MKLHWHMREVGDLAAVVAEKSGLHSSDSC